MILVDTSVWIDHFRNTVPDLAEELGRERVLMHPMVLGELACGDLHDRDYKLFWLSGLRLAEEATHAEVMHLIEQHRLMGCGIGYIDIHLLASAALSSECTLWTHDRRLRRAAEKLELAYRSS